MMATTTTTMAAAAAPTQRHRLLKKNGLRPMWMVSIFGLLLAIRAAQGFAFPAEPASLRRRGASTSWPAHVSTTRAVPRLLDNRQRRNAARPTNAWISTSLALSSTASSDDEDDASALVSPKNRKFVITPAGLGFTSPVRRILRKSGRAPGFHRALASDSVLAVQTAISSSASTSTPAFDVALVFDDADPTKLVGLFTESDYIKVRAARCRVLVLSHA
jgi:hypothetical protein